jgi:hypothetical protein
MGRQSGGVGGAIPPLFKELNNEATFQDAYFTRRRVFLALSLLQCQSLPISFLHAVTREKMAYKVKQSP